MEAQGFTSFYQGVLPTGGLNFLSGRTVAEKGPLDRVQDVAYMPINAAIATGLNDLAVRDPSLRFLWQPKLKFPPGTQPPSQWHELANLYLYDTKSDPSCDTVTSEQHLSSTQIQRWCRLRKATEGLQSDIVLLSVSVQYNTRALGDMLLLEATKAQVIVYLDSISTYVIQGIKGHTDIKPTGWQRKDLIACLGAHPVATGEKLIARLSDIYQSERQVAQAHVFPDQAKLLTWQKLKSLNAEQDRIVWDQQIGSKVCQMYV